MKRRTGWFLVVGILATTSPWRADLFAASGPSGFSADNALSHVRILADRIGPRKTGSDADLEAIRYITGVLEGYGLTVETLVVDEVTLRPGQRVKVDTVNLIARLPGKRPEAILIGAHHDSRNHLVPGALDDASGVAVVLEVARVLAENPPESSIWFTIFGAEEDGCLGSRHFVNHQDISSLKMVITLDPVGRGKVFLAPFPGPPSLGWNRAIHRIQQRKNLAGVLIDPFFALAPRFLKIPHLADHAAFLDRGVPALNLSSQFDQWEYHTRWDRLDRVEPDTLRTAGELVLGLVEDYDSRKPPTDDDPHYRLIRFPGLRVFLPSRVLWPVSSGSILIVLHLGLRALRGPGRGEAVLQGLRCSLVVGFLVALGLSGLFLSEILAEAWTGFLFPWYARQGLSLAMGVSLASVTGWLALKAAPRILPVVRPAPYLAAACALLLMMSGTALALGLPEIAFLFTPPLLAIAACFWVPGYRLRFLLVAASAIHLPGLLLPESYRAAISFTGLELPIWSGFAALVLLLLPLGLAIVGLTYQQDFLGNVWWRIFAHPNTLVVGLVVFIVLASTWVQFSSYGPFHRRTVLVREVIDLERGETRVELASQENLKGIRAPDSISEMVEPTGRFWSGQVAHRTDLLALQVVEEPSRHEDERTVRVSLTPDSPADGIRIRFQSPGGFLIADDSVPGSAVPTWQEVPEMEW
ncbi:MAG: M28 family metallopeptidase, partial [Acidobacteriota bacterium]